MMLNQQQKVDRKATSCYRAVTKFAAICADIRNTTEMSSIRRVHTTPKNTKNNGGSQLTGVGRGKLRLFIFCTYIYTGAHALEKIKCQLKICIVTAEWHKKERHAKDEDLASRQQWRNHKHLHEGAHACTRKVKKKKEVRTSCVNKAAK